MKHNFVANNATFYLIKSIWANWQYVSLVPATNLTGSQGAINEYGERIEMQALELVLAKTVIKFRQFFCTPTNSRQ